MNFVVVFFLIVVSNVNARPRPDDGSEEESKNATGPLWERSGKYEGDMILTPGQRNGMVTPEKRWTNGILYYAFKPGDHNGNQVATIEKALQAFKGTCLRVERAPQNTKDYVLIVRKAGCYSFVGRIGGVQELSLQDDSTGTCLYPNIILHEFLHAAGFNHQQSAQERDSYVKVFYENIQDGLAYAFNKFPTNNYGVAYDYSSVMHYSKQAFSKNGKDTIQALGDPNRELGNGYGMTGSDVLKLNRMYQEFCRSG